LEEKGLVPDAEVTVREVLPFNQTVTLQVQGQTVTLGYASAQHLFVELRPKAPEHRPSPM
jgi:Fe2+ transport system protein FeoA